MLKSQDKVKKLDELTKKRNLPAREQLVFQLQELKERYQASEQRATVRYIPLKYTTLQVCTCTCMFIYYVYVVLQWNLSIKTPFIFGPQGVPCIPLYKDICTCTY